MIQEMAADENCYVTRGNTQISVNFTDALSEDEFALKSYVDSEIAKLSYQDISLSSFAASPTAEYGTTFTSNVTLTYKFNKVPTAMKITAGPGTYSSSLTPALTGTIPVTGLSLTSGGSWTLSANHSEGTMSSKTSRSASLSWQYRLYYGAKDQDSAITSAFITGLTPKLAGSVATTFTVNAGAGQKIFFACPSTMTPHFYYSNTEVEFEKVGSEISREGSTFKYNVYRSGQAGLGNTTIEVRAAS